MSSAKSVNLFWDAHHDARMSSKPAQSPHLLQNQFDFNTQSGWARSGGPGAASKQVDDQRDNGKNQQQVNHESGDVKEYESAGPKNHEQYR
jgi:hypothetical protein